MDYHVSGALKSTGVKEYYGLLNKLDKFYGSLSTKPVNHAALLESVADKELGKGLLAALEGGICDEIGKCYSGKGEGALTFYLYSKVFFKATLSGLPLLIYGMYTKEIQPKKEAFRACMELSKDIVGKNFTKFILDEYGLTRFHEEGGISYSKVKDAVLSSKSTLLRQTLEERLREFDDVANGIAPHRLIKRIIVNDVKRRDKNLGGRLRFSDKDYRCILQESGTDEIFDRIKNVVGKNDKEKDFKEIIDYYKNLVKMGLPRNSVPIVIGYRQNDEEKNLRVDFLSWFIGKFGVNDKKPVVRHIDYYPPVYFGVSELEKGSLPIILTEEQKIILKDIEGMLMPQEFPADFLAFF